MKTLLVIAGPTASGKTALAENLASIFQCPIISADSRQFFKEIPIGTAQPSQESLNTYDYHFVASHHLTDDYSAGQFERDAGDRIIKLFENHDLVLVCGGSGLYIRALLDGLDTMPIKNEKLREELTQLYKNNGLDSLINRMPQSVYQQLNESDRFNPQRLMRFIEINELPKPPKTTPHPWIAYKKNINIIKLALNPEREKLYNIIDIRVDQMIADGLEDEVNQIPVEHRSINALQTVGYQEFFDYFEGKINKEKAIDLIKQHTKNYAKKQITWLRRENNISWLNSNDTKPIIELLNKNGISIK